MDTLIAPSEIDSASDLVVGGTLPPFTVGFKFEHILISVTLAHNRDIGQFDDSCAHQLRKGMLSYNGIHMVNAEAQYKHCSYDHHVKDCECGMCSQVRDAIARGDNTYTPEVPELHPAST